MAPGGEPITKCPVCRYDLIGLPRTHRCPECGFEYDQSMRIWWTARRGPSDIFKWVPPEGFVAIPILGLIGVYEQLWWALGLFLLGLALVTAFVIRPRRTWFVILSDSGLTVGSRSGASSFYPWEQLYVPLPSLLGIGRRTRSPGMIHKNRNEAPGGIELRLDELMWHMQGDPGAPTRTPISLPLDGLGWLDQKTLKGEVHRRWLRATAPETARSP